MNHKAMLTTIIAMSMAIFGSTIVVSYGVLQAEAANSGVSIAWCYADHKGSRCFDTHGVCSKNWASDDQAQTGCYKSKS